MHERQELGRPKERRGPEGDRTKNGERQLDADHSRSRGPANEGGKPWANAEPLRREMAWPYAALKTGSF